MHLESKTILTEIHKNGIYNERSVHDEYKDASV